MNKLAFTIMVCNKMASTIWLLSWFPVNVSFFQFNLSRQTQANLIFVVTDDRDN